MSQRRLFAESIFFSPPTAEDPKSLSMQYHPMIRLYFQRKISDVFLCSRIALLWLVLCVSAALTRNLPSASGILMYASGSHRVVLRHHYDDGWARLFSEMRGSEEHGSLSDD